METKVIKRHLWYIIAGTIIAGFVTEILNQYVITFWVYDEPWTFLFYPPFPVGVPLILGWLAMTFIALVLSILAIRLKPRTKWAYSWIIGWIIVGFITEIINSKVWQTWTYVKPHLWTKAVMPYLNFSVFVPILGYGGTGLATYWAYKYIIMWFGKGNMRDKVCYMKVSKKSKWKAAYKKGKYYFCSDECKKEFSEKPSYYAARGFF